jgi:putative NIF3 family GTP cyclohydrolase 1 type 2
MTTLASIASALDSLLDTLNIPDYPQAINGLQVETHAEIVKVAAAVDLRERTIQSAVDAGANLLLVHHGLFWAGLQPLRGPYYRRVHALLASGMGLYSSHLPLDAHPEIGNNVLLARELGLTPSAGFARYQSIDIGVSGETEIATRELIARAGRQRTKLAVGSVAYNEAMGDLHRRWCIGRHAARGSREEHRHVDRRRRPALDCGRRR